MIERSEYTANEGQARAAVPRIAAKMAADATRAEWRQVLARRDYKREARHQRTARRSHVRNSGRAALGVLATVATAAAAMVAGLFRVFGG